MRARPHPIRALSLFSGGLDSQLAVRILQRQGIAVQALIFKSIFFPATPVESMARGLVETLWVEDFTPRLVSLIERPRHGRGSGLNPCVDCHLAMLQRAGKIMEEQGLHFICTGEVLNQRPLSQNRAALELVARKSGYGDYILRPLSAQLLPITAPERLGWVDRQALYAFSGRSRKAQTALAQQLGLQDYPQPAGGCLLTEPGYAKRLRELMAHEGLACRDDIIRLRSGRHFRLGQARLIVGRDQAENAHLAELLRPGEIALQPLNCLGPSGLLTGTATESEQQLAAGILARYCDAPPSGELIRIEARLDQTTLVLSAQPLPAGQVEAWRI